MKKLIIYDLDGTLIDTREDIALSANFMRTQVGLPEISHALIATYVGRGVHHLISNCLQTLDNKKIEKGTKIYRDHYAKHMLDHSDLYPGVEEILKYYQNQKQAVMTNKPDPFSTEMLRSLGVARHLIEIIAGDAVYPKKPDPAGVFALMQKASCQAEEVLFIGDSLVDIETARNAGVAVAVLTHGFSSREQLQLAAPELIADNFHELVEMLKQKGW